MIALLHYLIQKDFVTNCMFLDRNKKKETLSFSLHCLRCTKQNVVAIAKNTAPTFL